MIPTPEDFVELDPHDFMDKVEAGARERKLRDDPPIYSPESTDGGTDWLSIAVSVVIFLIIFALLVAGVNWALMPSKAHAHSFYDQWCCSGSDCAPAPLGAVHWTPQGWSVSTPDIHEVVPFTDPRIRFTPPNQPQLHICEYPTHHLRCLYVPETQG